MNFFSRWFTALCALIAPFSPVRGEEEVVSAIILGGGVGGMTSALYLARAGLHPLVIEGSSPGGLLAQSHLVENWPGEMEISGVELTEKMHKQAEASGARFAKEEVVKVDFSHRPFLITTRSFEGAKEEIRQIRAESCIIAMGTQPNFLGIPGETGPDGYWGRGVSNCAVCDGSLYRNQRVGVVGGGDAAVLEALYLSEVAKEVLLFVREESFKGVENGRIKALLARPNVKIFYHTTLQEIKGDGQKLTRVKLTKDAKEREVMLDGLFLAIGAKPNTSLFREILKLDPRGYIELEKDQQTSVKGVYAVGDIADPKYKQASTAAGAGVVAALEVQQYLAGQPPLAQVVVKSGQLSSDKGEVVEITSLEQFQQELEKGDLPILVDFYATWCGPCKRLTPILETSAFHLDGKVKFLKVNVDKMGDLTNSYGIRSMPTVLFFDRSGELLERQVGADQIAALLKRLQQSP